MKKRITLVACFDKLSDEAIINSLEYLNFDNLCKVPYNIENRLENDTLPYHITLSAWDIDKEEFVIDKMKKIKFNPVKATFTFETTINSDNTKLLYLKPQNESNLRNIQKQAHSILPTARYNPANYVLHSTINIDKDHSKIDTQFNSLKGKMLELLIDKLCLFEIYPAKLISTQM